MTEVREVMSRYTNYIDPTESADRKERFRQAEESGEVEENAAMMIRDLLTSNLPDAEHETILQSLTPTPPSVLSLMRLGPIMEAEEELTAPDLEPPVVVTKCGPGRPPGRRNITSFPLRFLGVGMRRRKSQKLNPLHQGRNLLSPSLVKKITLVETLELSLQEPVHLQEES